MHVEAMHFPVRAVLGHGTDFAFSFQVLCAREFCCLSILLSMVFTIVTYVLHLLRYLHVLHLF